MEVFSRILDKLKGADFWIALCALAVGILGWEWIGTTKAEEKGVLNRQLSVVLILTVVAGSTIAIRRYVNREPTFPENLTGILVMRIAGDDANDSLKYDLIGNVSAELQKEQTGQQIEVYGSDEIIDENRGPTAAHKRARSIGQRRNAALVIWGRKIGDKKFYPRITVVAAPQGWSVRSERTRDVQSITELNLPGELTDEPFYLIYFATGYSYFAQNNYKEALPRFKAALHRKGGSPSELADLQFVTAFCHSSLGAGQKDVAAHLEEAIGLYEAAAKVYSQSDQQKWAMTQNNLGIAYADLPTVDRAVNLQKAIAAFEAALGVYTERDSPVDWAGRQNNLGMAYADLQTEDRAANVQKAIDAYEAALRVYTEKDFPYQWAWIQNNLGVAYATLPTGDRAANLEKAIAAYEAALRVRTEKNSPVDWAETQNNLGIAIATLPTGHHAANVQKTIAAVAAFKAALRVYTEKDFPFRWATTQDNLGNIYKDLRIGDRAANLQKAFAAYEAALRVRTEKDFPVEWAATQNNRGGAYADLQTGDHAANVQKAIDAYEAALRVYTEKDFPEYWAMTQDNLGLLYTDFTGENRTESLKNARVCFQAALRVYTEKNFPERNQQVAWTLAEAERELQSLTSK